MRRAGAGAGSEIDQALAALSDAPKRIADSGIPTLVACHPFGHSFATHSIEDGYNSRTIQEIPGHRDGSTTIIHTRVLSRCDCGVRRETQARSFR